MRRVIFVGMNNKPGLAPLCSSTKSGKLIDKVILELGCFECLKSNLFDIDHFPQSSAFNFEWAERVDYSNSDIIVALGSCVNEAFRKSPFKYIYIGHPSAVWSNVKKEEYIKNAVKKINDFTTTTI